MTSKEASVAVLSLRRVWLTLHHRITHKYSSGTRVLGKHAWLTHVLHRLQKALANEYVAQRCQGAKGLRSLPDEVPHGTH